MGLISYLLFRGIVSNNGLDLITRMYPIFSVIGIYLAASKASKIGQYWREIFIVSLTGIPWEHISSVVFPVAKVSILDAKISRLMLWYVGFDVSQRDNLVILPKGAIQIAGPCSSFDLLGLMWQSCLVICLYFTLKKNQQVLLWICSTLIALGVNGVRLCLMALLVANNRTAAFDYWHGSAGAEIFTTAAILILALVYFQAIARKRQVLPQV
ncbi:archaeosortase/exosortase family protein [Waterburya agarophytonicola]|uniref:archaeosortase/exosortase family protein n=1 Tax=Waterburya agarophytonicola TaxID=2886916 RepID=UPI001E2AA490|nr:archaeosortase/exosortase family protein [Waterburya agarophytonicola]